MRRGAARLALVAAVGASVALAGCSTTGTGGGSGSTVKAKGRTLWIYLSEPPSPVAEQTAALNAEQRACTQHSGEVTSFAVRCQVVHERELSANARTAIQNQSAVAYIGELGPGRSEQTVGITNAQDLLQVSPLDTALELTRATPAISGAPDRYYESLSTYGRTFGRVVPDDGTEAAALVAEMHRLGVKSVYVAGDGSDYGRALAHAVQADLGGAGLARAASESGADGVFVAASSASSAVRLFSSAPAGAKLFGPSALATNAFASATSRPVYISEAGSASALGAAAVTAVLSVLQQAGAAANDRATVVKDFLKQSHTTVATFSFVRVSGGALHRVP